VLWGQVTSICRSRWTGCATSTSAGDRQAPAGAVQGNDQRAIQQTARFKRQSGGARPFADITIEVKPLRAAAVRLHEASSARIPRNYIPSVEEGVMII